LASAESAEDRNDEVASAAARAPDSEVEAKPTRRWFSAADRLRIPEEADRCQDPDDFIWPVLK